MLLLSDVVANIIAGAISEAGYTAASPSWLLRRSTRAGFEMRAHFVDRAMAAGDLMQDLKCGHIVGASPRAQFFGQVRRSMHQDCLLKPRNFVFYPFFTHFPPFFAHFLRLDARNPGNMARSPGENGKKSKEIGEDGGN